MEFYRPYILAAAYPNLIGEQFRANPDNKVREDSQGTWVLQRDWELHTEDFALCQAVETEQQRLSQLYWELELGGLDEYPAIQQLCSYGWRDNESLVFCKAVQSGSHSLLDLLVKGNLEVRVPGATRMLTSRCLFSVMVTTGNLLLHHNLAPANVTLDNLRMRDRYTSGYLQLQHLVQAPPSLTQVDKFPFYPASTSPQEIDFDTVILACVACLCEALDPVGFNKVKD